MKIATSPGPRVDRHVRELVRELRHPARPAETAAEAAAEPLSALQDPAAVRLAAERLRALVEKRGA
ncbi:MAG TPA: hypothetical protein VFO89_17470 [Thermoanaerobaculia bacterium]|nr:hypothetical protein [Thermoanaerobaculia bacterium]